MQNEELEERVTMLEELIQAFTGRINGIDTNMAEFLKSLVEQYCNTMETIAARIESANKRYDDQKIQQQIDELKDVVVRVPKVIGVRNTHHFGAWSISLIISVVVCFVITAGSIGTALYFYHQNDRLNQEAYNFWLVKALYPEVAKNIEVKLTEDPKGFINKAEKAMAKQQAIIAAEAVAAQAEKDQKEAKRKLEKVKANK